jgi:secreted trypsin-like serine protease
MSTRRPLSLVSLVSLSLALGCSQTESSPPGADGSPPQALPIVEGAPTAAYPEAGALMMGGQSFCTGTLIGPHTVLTAAHCVVNLDPSQAAFGIGSSQSQLTEVLPIALATVYPQYDAQQLINDVAVVTLSADASIAPMPMNQAMDASWVGKTVTLVGFGVDNGPQQTGGGIKRDVDVTIAQIDATTLHYTTQQGKSACNGDSGGPAFAEVGGSLVVAGITSYGDLACQQFGV